MDITSAKYIKDALVSDDNIPIKVVSNGKTYFVPLDPNNIDYQDCLLYTSPSPRDGLLSRMPSSA